MAFSWFALIISIALILPHKVVLQCATTAPPDCSNCQNCNQNPPKVLSVRDDDDSDSKETKVRDTDSDETEPRYAIIAGGNGNLALLDIAEQWPQVKRAVGNSGKFDGVVLQHLNQPLKSLLELSNASLKRFNDFFKLPNLLSQKDLKPLDKGTKEVKDNVENLLLARDSWGSPGGSRSYG